MSLFNRVFKKKKEEDNQNTEIRNSTPAIKAGQELEIKKEIKAAKKAVENKMDKANIKEGKGQVNQVINVKAKKGSIGYRILVKPLVTEKTAALAKEGKYIFEVSQESNKIMVKNAFRDFYGVSPQDVNIIKVRGKKTGAIRRIKGKRKNWKKAIVTLKSGESINIYGGAK